MLMKISSDPKNLYLIQYDTIRNFRLQSLRGTNMSLRTIPSSSSRCPNNFRTKCPQRINFFIRHFFRHHNNAPISLNSRSHSQADSRVSTRRFNNRRSRFKYTLLLSINYHPVSYPILNRTSRIQVFTFHDYNKQKNYTITITISPSTLNFPIIFFYSVKDLHISHFIP